MRRVQIRELGGWDLDDYEYRPPISGDRLLRAKTLVAERPAFIPRNPVISLTSGHFESLFEAHACRTDLLEEMTGLSWSLGIVDLSALIAFQRRLYFPEGVRHPSAPAADDWPALAAHCFAVSQSPDVEKTRDLAKNVLILRSDNPNTHIRMTEDSVFPLTVHTGSPFFEIASYAGRWFLRDGYHRAFALLKAGVRTVPAVIVHATTIEELGSDRSWFFPQQILFSQSPPLVTDFLEDDLVIQYDRPRLIRTLRVSIEDTLTPESNAGEQS